MSNKNEAYGYAVVSGVMRYWEMNGHTANNFVSWSSQELEYLTREKEGIKNFLASNQEDNTPSNN